VAPKLPPFGEKKNTSSKRKFLDIYNAALVPHGIPDVKFFKDRVFELVVFPVQKKSWLRDSSAFSLKVK
jgi:hypothetical protein